jgi:hypothetical protein
VGRRAPPALALGVVLAVSSDLSAQAPEERFQFGGWARSSLERDLGGAGYDLAAPDPLEVPRDRLIAREQLHLRERYARGGSLEAVVSGLLDYDVFAPRGGLDVRTRFEAELREAWLGFYTRRADFRAGNQRVAWGQGDFFPVNDVVNARDIRDPLLTETELRYFPTFLLRADAAIGSGSLQVLVAPFFRADRYDVYGTNWAFIQPGTPAGYRGFLSTLAQAAGAAPEDAGRLLLSDEGLPEDDLSGLEAGGRVEWRAGRLNVAHYYHFGRHGTPDFQVDSALGGILDTVDWSTVGPEEVRALAALVAGSPAVRSEWPRRHHFGLGLATTASRFALRLDAAYEHEGLFYDHRLNGWRSPVVQAVGALELSSDDPGRALLVELFQQWLTRTPPADLLFSRRATTALGLLARRTWRERLEFELRAVAGVSPASYLLRPQVAWKKAALAVRLGVVLPGGEDLAYGGWFERNRSVYVMLKQSF